MRATKLLLVLAMGLALTSRLEAQATARVSGTVVNDRGQPIASANVVVQGTRIGTLSGPDGRYVLVGVPAGTHTVAASLIGFGDATQTVTVSAGETATVNFQLTIKAVALQGVVAVGYGTQQRRTVTGAVSTVKAQQIAEMPTSNPIKAIQGRVPGVDIVNNGNKPGDPIRILIRGVRSITANIEPLYVVDGVPILGGIGDFDPNDIVSIDILKDAAATAVYGSRGANGVVLITTKGSAAGGVRTQFSANVNVANQDPYGLPDMMNMAQYVQMLQDAAAYAGVSTDPRSLLNNNQFNAFQAGQETDWQELIKRTGVQRNAQFGMSGVSENTRFNISANYFDQTGTAVGFGYNRFGGQASVDHQHGRLRIGATANYTRSLQETALGDGLWGAARQQTGFGLPYDSTGALIINPDGDALAFNPLRAVEMIRNDTRRDRIFASSFASFDLTEGVNLRVNFGPDWVHQSVGNFTGPSANFGGAAFRTAFYNQTTQFQYILDNMLQVNRDFGELHHVDATLLYGIQKFRQVIANESAQNIPYDEALYYGLNQGNNFQVTTGLTETALESLMGRAVYTFMQRYTISAALRRDGASQLAPGNKWVNFPTLGLAWQVGEEPFMQDFGWLSSLKLRASWGKTGNSSIGAYQTQGALSNGKINFGPNGTNAYFPDANNPANADLGWEKTTKKDLGLEFAILNSRVSGAVDLYTEDTKDLLLRRSLPGTSGYTSALQNIGSTKNNGLELQLSTVNLQDWHGIRWQTDLSWAHNKNQITGLAAYSDTAACPPAARQCDATNGWFVGFPINTGGRTDPLDSNGNFFANGSDPARRQWFDYQFVGIWQQNEATEAARYGSKPGQIKVLDTNNDGVINVNDKVLQGSTYPKWTASIYNRFTWKSFDASALINIRWDYTIWNSYIPSLFGRNGQIVTEYWTPANPVNTNPSPNLNGNTIQYANTRGYIDASHWRIRNIQLGYTVPAELAKKVGASTARIYAVATEPYVSFDFDYFDPEAGWAGGSPVYKTLLVGANVTF
jgi:TonB-linked SusC/RagA family outer membrane protein